MPKQPLIQSRYPLVMQRVGITSIVPPIIAFNKPANVPQVPIVILVKRVFKLQGLEKILKNMKASVSLSSKSLSKMVQMHYILVTYFDLAQKGRLTTWPISILI